MNMKLITFIAVSAITIELIACVPHFFVGNGKVIGDDKSIRKHTQKVHISTELQKTSNVGFSFCPTCIDFADQALDILLNAVLQIGVIGTCGDICSIVQQKTGSQILGVVCNLLCDIAGVDEFVKIVENADLDPIYYCELLHACPIKDNGDAKITSLTVSPQKGPQGQFTVDLKYTSVNGTGTGEIVIAIKTVDNIPLEDGFLILPQEPGNYDTKITIKAEPDPDCDPTQGPCEAWLPGQYIVKMLICNGECGSKHPHSAIYDTGVTNFTITN